MRFWPILKDVGHGFQHTPHPFLKMYLASLAVKHTRAHTCPRASWLMTKPCFTLAQGRPPVFTQVRITSRLRSRVVLPECSALILSSRPQTAEKGFLSNKRDGLISGDVSGHVWPHCHRSVSTDIIITDVVVVVCFLLFFLLVGGYWHISQSTVRKWPRVNMDSLEAIRRWLYLQKSGRK